MKLMTSSYDATFKKTSHENVNNVFSNKVFSLLFHIQKYQYMAKRLDQQYQSRIKCSGLG